VEIASLGLSICAERAAVFAARGRMLIDPKSLPITAVAISTKGNRTPWPCGACRQVLAEFARGDAWIILQGPEGIHEVRLADLLPHPFGEGVAR
jgi:cytidine deaminase